MISVVLGACFGDEGKGKLIDFITTKGAVPPAVVARCAGGSNAGHTIVVGGRKFACHLLPSGCVGGGKATLNVIGNGVVVHPLKLLVEIDALRGFLGEETFHANFNLVISDRAHLVFTWMQVVDRLREEEKLGGTKIGTTGQGIGPAYASKSNRSGLRFGYFIRENWDMFTKAFVSNVASKAKRYPQLLDPSVYDIQKELAELFASRQRLAPYLADTVNIVNQLLDKGSSILVEGANAALIDIDHGAYPYITSSSCTIGGVSTGLGIPLHIYPTTVYGVMKAYVTRVGNGTFPTEVSTDEGPGKHIAEKGREFGTTTGRPRRIGWFDSQMVRYSGSINGYNGGLCLAKLDVLSGLEVLKICTGYKGLNPTTFPAEIDALATVEPIYITLPGWNDDISSVRRFENLPDNCKAYVKEIQKHVAPWSIMWIGVGPGREDMIEMFGEL